MFLRAHARPEPMRNCLKLRAVPSAEKLRFQGLARQLLASR